MQHRSNRARTCVLLILVLGWIAIGQRAHAEPQDAVGGSLSEVVEDFRTLQLAKEAIPAVGQTVEIGHLRLTFAEGQIVPLRSRGGAILGLYVEGRGNYSYKTEDAADMQVIEANITAVSNASIYKDLELHDMFDRALLFFARPAFEAVWNVKGQESAAVTETTEKGFDKVWKRIAKTYLEYDHLAAEARLGGGDGQYVYAEIEGAQETLGYSYDSLRDFEERVFLFRKFSGYDLRFQQGVSEQLVDGGPTGQPISGKLTHAEFDVSTRDNRSGRIVSDLTFDIGRDGLSVLSLRLMNNRDPFAYDWESERNRLNVVQVTDDSGRPLSFSHRYHEILVQLPAPAVRGERVVLRFETEGEVLTGMTGERHDNYFELFSDAWFPRPSDWRAREFTMSMTVTTKKPWRPVASGTVTKFEELDDSYVLETRADRPVKVVALFAGKYKVYEETFEDVTIRVYGYAAASHRVLKNMPKLAHAFVSFYGDTLIPYPFDELNIIEVPEYGFGIAPSGTVLITSEAYKPRQDFLAEYFSRGINARLAHEIAHQWFGHVAMPASHRDTWISESFAEYVSGLAMGAIVGKKARVMGFDQMFAEWWRYTLASRDAGPISAASMLTGPNARAERFYLLYCRGPLVLRMLHSMVGNERFYAILGTFLRDADMGHVTTDDFRIAAEKVLKTDMRWFFDQWIEEGGVPEIGIEHKVRQAESGKLILEGTARFVKGHGFKKMRIPIVLEFKGANPEVRWVDMIEPTTEFAFELPRKPSDIKVDPAQNFLAQFK